MSVDATSARKPDQAAVAAKGHDSLPPDLKCEYEPIRLEDLLSGLPEIEGEDEFSALAKAALEPALLLAEIAQEAPVTTGGWAAAEPEPAAPKPPPEEPAAATSLVVEEMRQSDPGALMETLAAIAALPAEEEAEPEAEPVAVEVPAEEPAAAEEPEPVADATGDDLATRIDAIIAAHAASGLSESKGDSALPENREALALLLSEPPPAEDFAALDALYACWPRTTHHCDSRALLAVAHNVSRNFGLPGKLPMTTSKAWRMLSPETFEAELAQRLADVGRFIADWQKTQRTFLILEFNEVELIEYLFEALHPGDHADLLAGVMNFKVLSNRRLGLLRRIPSRIKKQVLPMLPDRKDEALVLLAHAKALLDRIADPSGFAPIVNTANKMAEEIERAMKSIASLGAPAIPPPQGGPVALGPIG